MRWLVIYGRGLVPYTDVKADGHIELEEIGFMGAKGYIAILPDDAKGRFMVKLTSRAWEELHEE